MHWKQRICRKTYKRVHSTHTTSCFHLSWSTNASLSWTTAQKKWQGAIETYFSEKKSASFPVILQLSSLAFSITLYSHSLQVVFLDHHDQKKLNLLQFYRLLRGQILISFFSPPFGHSDEVSTFAMASNGDSHLMLLKNLNDKLTRVIHLLPYD